MGLGQGVKKIVWVRLDGERPCFLYSECRTKRGSGGSLIKYDCALRSSTTMKAWTTLKMGEKTIWISCKVEMLHAILV